MPTQPARGFDSREQALEQLTRRLYVEGDAEKQARLRQALADGLEEDGGAFHIRGAAPLQPAIVVIQGAGGRFPADSTQANANKEAP